jgi:hypothetical protein
MTTPKARPWRLAAALQTLRAQVNSLALQRSRKSDGSIGDAAHASRDSDHNPWIRDGAEGVVTAIDLTHDPAGGCDAHAIAAALVEARDSRVKYIIWNKRIVRSSDKPGMKAWTWQPYTGRNTHEHHVHISVKPEKSAYDSKAQWTIRLT